MRIELGLGSMKLTNVPREEDLDKERKYYVYEWFIKEDGRVFYIGKGKGTRYKGKKNPLFLDICEAFECDYRFVKENLTEYEALVLEEELFKQREDERHVLANIQTPNATGALTIEGKEEGYLITPKILPNRIEAAYFGAESQIYDVVTEEGLNFVHVPKRTTHGLGLLYANDPNLPQQEYEKVVNDYINQVEEHVKNKGGKWFKSKAKSTKTIITYQSLTLRNFQDMKSQGYTIYHLVDVIKFLNLQTTI
ncbi:hypothetical protein U8V72_26945 [Priestia filamentosa]|uniref:hypothetical protein n=1 Tax=Priestia filamentosa TaxID=1402861 RepID=UPI00397E64CD